MSDFEDITIKNVGFAYAKGVSWYPALFDLSRIPDKKWEECFHKVFLQSQEQRVNEYERAVDREFDDFPEDMKRTLIEQDVDSFKEFDRLINQYELNDDRVIIHWIYGRDVKDGLEAVKKFYPEMEEWLEAANNCRKKSER
jgi:hypothetical protein